MEKIAACIEEQYFSNIDFAIESIGILGNLNLPDINYEQIFVKYNLIPFIKNVLKTGKLLKMIYIYSDRLSDAYVVLNCKYIGQEHI